jgi:hypothetical protein
MDNLSMLLIAVNMVGLACTIFWWLLSLGVLGVAMPEYKSRQTIKTEMDIKEADDMRDELERQAIYGKRSAKRI